MEKHNLINHQFIVKELSFVRKDKKDGNFTLKPKFGKRIVKIDDTTYEVGLRVDFIDTPEEPFPFNLTVVTALLVSFPDNTFSDETLKEFLNVNCIQILFPYLRTLVTNMTSSAMVKPIVLPIVDVREFEEERDHEEVAK